MEQALKNIFQEDAPGTRYVQVTAKFSKYKYQVTDVYGRVWLVDSHEPWAVGSYVTIQNGWIVGKGVEINAPKTFSV